MMILRSFEDFILHLIENVLKFFIPLLILLPNIVYCHVELLKNIVYCTSCMEE